jgi:hypothetical protein
MRRTIACLFFLCVAGCQIPGPMSPDDLLKHDPGTPPADYQEQIKAHFDGVLYDPYDAHYTYHEPVADVAGMLVMGGMKMAALSAAKVDHWGGIGGGI